MSAPSNIPKSLRERRGGIDPITKREQIMNEIKDDYTKNGQYRVIRAEQKNIMLIGRTRTGKSTIKSLLVDPTLVPDDLTLKSGTKYPVFESFYVRDNQIVLNIIDTPGLFEHNNTTIDIRDNETILQTIQICINREITKFHAVCFCVAITTGINREDIESLKLLVDFLGDEISSNSCLIVTRCESKTDSQRTRIAAELLEDSYFKEIAPFFKLGIFFSGSLNRDDYNQGNENLYNQFFTITDYRTKLIEMFTGNIEPFLISEMAISQVRQALDERSHKDVELTEAQERADEQARLIEDLKAAHLNDQRNTAEIIDRLIASVRDHEEQARSGSGPSGGRECLIS